MDQKPSDLRKTIASPSVVREIWEGVQPLSHSSPATYTPVTVSLQRGTMQSIMTDNFYSHIILSVDANTEENSRYLYLVQFLD